MSLQPAFPKLVKDALTHYWGGPKLSDSPLLALRAVRRQLGEQGGSPTKALQTVLRQAIDNMRPNDQLDPSAPEAGAAPVAAAPLVAPAPAAASGGTYTVQAGDTLGRIAAAQGVAGGWQALYAANDDRLSDPNRISVGQVLQLP